MDYQRRHKVRYLMQEAGFAQHRQNQNRAGIMTGFANAWEGLTKQVGPIPPGVDMLGPFMAGRYGNEPKPLLDPSKLRDLPELEKTAARGLTLDSLKTFGQFHAYTHMNLGVTIKPEKLELMQKAFDEGRYSAKDFGSFIAASMRKELTMDKGLTKQQDRGMDV